MKQMKFINKINILPLISAAHTLVLPATLLAQTTPLPADQQKSPPEFSPAPPTSLSPSVPSVGQKPTTATSTSRPVAGATSETKVDPIVGLAVFSSDGQKVGDIHDVKTEGDGKVSEVYIKTGGFLGFGTRTVAIPSEKMTRSGQNVQLTMTYDDVTKLPEKK